MRLLLIITQPFDPTGGGVQRSTAKIASYLNAKGHDVAVFSFANTNHQPTSDVRFFQAHEKGRQFNVNNLVFFKEWLDRNKFDCIINQMPYEHAIGAVLVEAQKSQKFLLLGCLRNTLFSVKLNLGNYVKNAVPSLLQQFFNNYLGKKLLLLKHKQKHRADLKKILDTYDYFVMFGPPNQKELEYFVGDYKSHKTAFIPNSIPKVLPEVPRKEKRILWLSRLSYGQKRADLILPFWKKVMHEFSDWQFDVVGAGDAFDDLKEEIVRDRIPRITLHGKQPPDVFYKRAPIYIMTSAFEGFPNTLIEAQSYGCVPVVYDNYPICSWVIEHNTNGKLVAPFKVKDMADHVKDLIADYRSTESMMDAALKNARRFTIDNVGKKWLSLLEEKKIREDLKT